MLSLDLLHPCPPVHCGHKGLFFDRLDVGVVAVGAGRAITEHERLAPGAELCGYARNRHYSPRHGRWLQMDPNATGAALAEDASSHGRGLDAVVRQFDLARNLDDGSNPYQYLGSSSWSGHDVLGLYMEDGEYDGEDFFEDLTDGLGLLNPIPGPSDFIRGALQAMTEDYAANMEFDLDWAMDWSLPDDDHSRLDSGWVNLAIARGVHDAFDVGLPFSDQAVNILDAFASGVNSATPVDSDAIYSSASEFKSSSPKSKGKSASVHASTKAGHTLHTARGQREHDKYRLKWRARGYQTEFIIPGHGRADAVDVKNRIVRELKPNTPSGRYRMSKQLARYKAGLEAKSGGKWTAIPDWY